MLALPAAGAGADSAAGAGVAAGAGAGAGAGAAVAGAVGSGSAGWAGALAVVSPVSAVLATRGLRTRFSTGASVLPVSEGVFSDKCLIPLAWMCERPGRAANWLGVIRTRTRPGVRHANAAGCNDTIIATRGRASARKTLLGHGKAGGPGGPAARGRRTGSVRPGPCRSSGSAGPCRPRRSGWPGSGHP